LAVWSQHPRTKTPTPGDRILILLAPGEIPLREQARDERPLRTTGARGAY